MKSPSNKLPASEAEIRRRAEARLNERAGKVRARVTVSKATGDMQRTYHELQVHQIELEMQNAELRKTRDELESLLENYTDLYDFAPVGYFTLAASGVILEANLTGASMAGMERSRLIGVPFDRLVAVELRPVFDAFLKKVFSGDAKQSGEFDLLRMGPLNQTVNIEAKKTPGGLECRIAVLDITERKRVEAAQRRMEIMAASNRSLELEIARRKTIERALKKSEEQQNQLSAQLRHLSHEMLHAQEDERKRISRELHDVILQSLVGINIHLTALSGKSGEDPQAMRQKIAETQRLVGVAVTIVHRFAVDLRPTVLDDLGLIPALHTFLKEFTKGTGVRARLSAFATVEKLPIATRTILYRVALEALNNVAVHAEATNAEVRIENRPECVRLTITDDGKSFDVRRAIRTKGRGRLGLLGMRERLEMVGGQFNVESAPGKGTTIDARIPFGKHTGEGRRRGDGDPKTAKPRRARRAGKK